MNINEKPPKRLAVMKALQVLLQGITKAEGYRFDMTHKVIRNQILLGADVTDEPPLIAIIEAPRADFAFFAGEDNSRRADKWTILIQGIVADDRTDDTFDDAYYLCQDVERRLMRLSAVKPSGSPLYADDHLLGGMITSVDVAPPVVRPPEAATSRHAFFYLPIRLGIAVEIGD